MLTQLNKASDEVVIDMQVAVTVSMLASDLSEVTVPMNAYNHSKIKAPIIVVLHTRSAQSFNSGPMEHKTLIPTLVDAYDVPNI